MIELIRWTERRWSFSLPVGVFPAVVERLRGTPARVTELLSAVEEDSAAARLGSAWSAKEHVGHLSDLHELEERRIHEFIEGIGVLSAADLANRRTEQAEHGTTPIAEILRRFRHERDAFVKRLESLSADEVAIAALHPRLGQHLRLVDWAYFVAEHDDHHLALARRALRAAQALSASESKPRQA
jgi:hypothetical protein